MEAAVAEKKSVVDKAQRKLDAANRKVEGLKKDRDELRVISPRDGVLFYKTTGEDSPVGIVFGGQNQDELEAFASFGSDLDAVSQAQLDRGYRLTELLKQGISSPMPVQEQVVVLFAGTRGYLDSVPVTDVSRFEAELLEHFSSRHSGLLEEIGATGQIPDEEDFESMVKTFADGFTPSDGPHEAPEAHDPGELEHGLVDADYTLPEEEIHPADDEG